MNPSSQRGSAIFFVFVGIALFGALIYAVMRGSSGSSTIMSDEQTKVYAQQIIGFSMDVGAAVKRLKLRGCADTELSFDNPIVSGYANSSAPSSKKCNVFDQAGGGLAYNLIPIPSAKTNKYIFNGSNVLIGKGGLQVGTSNPELMIIAPFGSKQLCDTINQKFNNPTNDYAIDHIGAPVKFDGSYVGSNGMPDNGGIITDFYGALNGCLKTISTAPYYDYVGDDYFFYSVLIAR